MDLIFCKLKKLKKHQCNILHISSNQRQIVSLAHKWKYIIKCILFDLSHTYLVWNSIRGEYFFSLLLVWISKFKGIHYKYDNILYDLTRILRPLKTFHPRHLHNFYWTPHCIGCELTWPGPSFVLFKSGPFRAFCIVFVQILALWSAL